MHQIENYWKRIWFIVYPNKGNTLEGTRNIVEKACLCKNLNRDLKYLLFFLFCLCLSTYCFLYFVFASFLALRHFVIFLVTHLHHYALQFCMKLTHCLFSQANICSEVMGQDQLYIKFLSFLIIYLFNTEKVDFQFRFLFILYMQILCFQCESVLSWRVNTLLRPRLLTRLLIRSVVSLYLVSSFSLCLSK